MYIDARDRGSHPPRPRGSEPWRPNLRPLVPFAIAVPMLVVAPMVPPLASYGLTVGAGVLICRTAAKLIPSSNGLEDHRQ